MPLNLLSPVMHNASFLAHRVLDDLGLGIKVPDRLLVTPPDLHIGNTDSGRAMLNGTYTIGHASLSIENNPWYPSDANHIWMNHIHGFSWLRDIKAVGSHMARRHMRMMIQNWINAHPMPKPIFTWRPDLAGERLSTWITLYPWFSPNIDSTFHDLFFKSLIRHAHHLYRTLPGQSYGLYAMRGIRGLILAGLAFEGHEKWLQKGLYLLKHELDAQILKDGGHISRNADDLHAFLDILLDIRTALGAANYPVPEIIEEKLFAGAQALRFFRHGDKGFAGFNGAKSTYNSALDHTLSLIKRRSRLNESLPQSGYERMALGRTLVMFDAGKTPIWPYDNKAHASPLAFEMSYGKHRMFVSCGTHTTDTEWDTSLRATAAHNTAILDNLNACEISQRGHFNRKSRNAMVIREETDSCCLIEASHDGYVLANGITHRRRLYLSDRGQSLRGEDTFTCPIGLSKSVPVALRFHIHPRVLVSLIREGSEALLRLPEGTGWRFFLNGGTLKLEDSIHIPDGHTIQKTKQLVITSSIENDMSQIKWGVQKEG